MAMTREMARNLAKEALISLQKIEIDFPVYHEAVHAVKKLIVALAIDANISERIDKQSDWRPSNE